VEAEGENGKGNGEGEETETMGVRDGERARVGRGRVACCVLLAAC
jgi:hypothetical protein